MIGSQEMSWTSALVEAMMGQAGGSSKRGIVGNIRLPQYQVSVKVSTRLDAFFDTFRNDSSLLAFGFISPILMCGYVIICIVTHHARGGPDNVNRCLRVPKTLQCRDLHSMGISGGVLLHFLDRREKCQSTGA